MRASRLTLALSLAALLLAPAAPGYCWMGGYNHHKGKGKCYQGNNGGGCSNGKCSSKGSPAFEIATFTGNLTLEDTPVWYQSVGDEFSFTLQYNSDSTRTGPMGDRWRTAT